MFVLSLNFVITILLHIEETTVRITYTIFLINLIGSF